MTTAVLRSSRLHRQIRSSREPSGTTPGGKKVKSRQAALWTTSVVLLLIASALAQKPVLQAVVPFEFTLGQVSLAAGEYCISIQGPATLRVARIDGRGLTEVSTVSLPHANDPTPRLVFHRYGFRHFLAEVWFSEPNLVRQVYASAAELDLARTTKQELTTIIATVKSAK